MTHSIETKIGLLTISAESGCITGINFGAQPSPPDDSPRGLDSDAEAALLEKAARQLQEYFAGERKIFDLPLRLMGTSFQSAVWNELGKIPFGETRSYGDIARALGKEAASRAVGGACKRNPIAIVIPCHRVIGKSGALTGFAGGVDVKRALLYLEKDAVFG